MPIGIGQHVPLDTAGAGRERGLDVQRARLLEDVIALPEPHPIQPFVAWRAEGPARPLVACVVSLRAEATCPRATLVEVPAQLVEGARGHRRQLMPDGPVEPLLDAAQMGWNQQPKRPRAQGVKQSTVTLQEGPQLGAEASVTAKGSTARPSS
jgi:hypothetical protein